MHTKKDSHLDIHQAILSNDYNKVEDLLKSKVSPNRETGNKNTPLHIAAMKKRLSIIKLLKNYSANPNLQNFHGSTPLHIAAYKKNSLKAVKLLLDMGADANKTDRYGNAPLHIATNSHGDVKMVKALLEAGANPNAVNSDSKTAFSMAKENNNAKCMEALIFAGSKFQSSILKMLSKSFFRTKILKKIVLVSFSLAVLSITIAASIATSGKTAAGILFAAFATLGMTIICLEEEYHKLQEAERKAVNNKI